MKILLVAFLSSVLLTACSHKHGHDAKSTGCECSKSSAAACTDCESKKTASGGACADCSDKTKK